MEHLSEINQNLVRLRETNKLLKTKCSENEKELQKLRQINLDQEKRINELESRISNSAAKMVNNLIINLYER